jgi:hypothetical protein
MSAPPLNNAFFYRMATSLNKAWADWFVSLGSSWDSFTSTIASLGTMATQNANNVAITGGSISGATGPAYLASANVFTQQNTFSAGGIVLPTGTFTPTLVSSGGGVPTYSLQLGRYVLLGNSHVAFNAVITLSAFGTLAAGTLTVAGLPFTAADTGISNVCSITANNLDATAATDLQARVATNAAAVQLIKYAAGTRSVLTKANISSTALIELSGIYEI